MSRVTLPIEQGMDDVLPEIISRLGADAVRNSDGTWLPAITPQLGAKVYETYFPARGDQEFALAHLKCRPHFYLMSARTTAAASGPLSILVMQGYFAMQVEPDLQDFRRWWEVIDRTSGEVVDTDRWSVTGEGVDVVVTVTDPEPFHVYTVSFLAFQAWDSTQMYNYTTNHWENDPTRVREIGYDVREPEVWEHMCASLDAWCKAKPEVDVVRFTTFFYHFTLVFNDHAKEKYVDWFGYSASVSPRAMDAFEEEYGYALRAEDFIDEGYYNSPFRTPTKQFRDWIEFQTRFVCGKVRELVDIVHRHGKEALMFLGDTWIGTEPYAEEFAKTGMDGVVGSVGSAATCRMISDIPGLAYTEGRFLPYFFPDVFREGGDPLAEANECWLQARRAIARKPLDRIGYGGYLSLARKFPEFMARIEEICDEFRAIHERSGGHLAATAPIRVGILNAWGSLRTWQTHMVAHALLYKEITSYLGVLEALAGLPFDLRFLSFDEARDGALAELDVVLNVGTIGTAFSGGDVWLDPALTVAVRKFVAQGGGFIGVGDPTAAQANGACFQLSDVLGVDKELSLSLSTDRYPVEEPEHFITADLDGPLEVGNAVGDIVGLESGARILRLRDGSVDLACHEFQQGRSVYLAGLPYSPINARVLHRAIAWAAQQEEQFEDQVPSNPLVEVAEFTQTGQILLMNLSKEPVHTTLRGIDFDLSAMESRWVEVKK